MEPSPVRTGVRAAALAVPALALLWGLNWPAVRVLLTWWSPWTVRAVGLGAGALVLFALARARGQPLSVARGMRLRLAVSALLSIVGFNLGTAFAQLAGSTSRAAIVTFTMPIWAVLLAWAFAGETPDRRRVGAVVLGVAGLSLLALPLLAAGASSLGVLLALAAGVSWAGGTVFVKRWPLAVPPLAGTAWQLTVGALVSALGWAVFGSAPSATAGAPWPVHWFALALVYHVVLAMALAYVIWFDVVARLPGGVAALGTLLVPVVGVAGAMLLLGERPSLTDLAGFALISGAAAIALLPPQAAVRKPS
ncbi:MAG: DMT family transporter [Burkholderiales bacterium]|jgi:drug/metabolite transporter (DMT)-like permease|nr:DMT family transporter [Burkholderiales bacterium]